MAWLTAVVNFLGHVRRQLGKLSDLSSPGRRPARLERGREQGPNPAGKPHLRLNLKADRFVSGPVPWRLWTNSNTSAT